MTTLEDLMDRVMQYISIIDEQIDVLLKLNVDSDPAWDFYHESSDILLFIYILAELIKTEALLLKEIICIEMQDIFIIEQVDK
jgi:hypothetical protein